jgi:hypothetical protein
MKNPLPVYCSSSFKWKNKQGTCIKSDLIVICTHDTICEYPGVLIKSVKTGKILYFEPVHDQDGYDGEFMVYSSDTFFITIWNY